MVSLTAVQASHEGSLGSWLSGKENKVCHCVFTSLLPLVHFRGKIRSRNNVCFYRGASIVRRFTELLAEKKILSMLLYVFYFLVVFCSLLGSCYAAEFLVLLTETRTYY